MWPDIDRIFDNSRGKGAIIDTNLLLLFIVGSHDPDRIGTFKRTDTFTKEDFVLLRKCIDWFKTVRTTPSILTEVSNFLGYLPTNLIPGFYSAFTSCIARCVEMYEPSENLSRSHCFGKYGLTDTATIADAAKKHVVLTVDFPLAGYLDSCGIDVINFNNLRPLAWSRT